MEKVLLIDDDRGLNALMSYFLRQQGIRLDSAFNGAEGWQRLMESEYDLIVCDIQMPEMDGRQLYAQVTQDKPHLARRFIFVTGAVDSAEVQTFLRESGCYYFQKPFTHGVFIDVLWQTWRRCVAGDHQPARAPVEFPNTPPRTEAA
jgi:CheY-like chemotaxis protein